jgi:RNA polymerase sigma factor (sigma-70 family)
MNLETTEYNCAEKQFTDARSFSDFYERYQNLVYRTALMITFCPDSARDISQDVFLKLWTKRHEIDPVNHLGGYVYKYARFRALNFLQENKKHRGYIELGTLEPNIEFTEPHEGIEVRQVRESIHKVAKKVLPQRCKLVYLLEV